MNSLRRIIGNKCVCICDGQNSRHVLQDIPYINQFLRWLFYKYQILQQKIFFSMYYKSAKYMVCMPHKPLVEFGNSSSYHFVFLIFSETGINKISHSKTKSNQRNGKNTFFHQIIALTNFFSTFHLEKKCINC